MCNLPTMLVLILMICMAVMIDGPQSLTIRLSMVAFLLGAWTLVAVRESKQRNRNDREYARQWKEMMDHAE